ncbi:MAG: TIGR02391 family protein [Brevundimonas sp. 12-68-7]|nr:MAG: TIGR02391 family protein [Brevundimonas sp. 12-68-7]
MAERTGAFVTSEEATQEPLVHPFEQRNFHPQIVSVSRKLFDDGHYSQATFEALKRLDREVSKLSGVQESGFKLMMQAFNEAKPLLKLNKLQNASDQDEQLGMKHIFAGAMSAIRNPRAHEVLTDQIDLCLDHLSVASCLFRVLDARPPA